MTWQTLIAAGGLGVIAWFLSHAIFARQPPRMRAVLVTLVVASLIMTVLGSLLFVALYWTTTSAFTTDIHLGAVNWAIYFLKLGSLTAFFWLPVLLIVALSQARRIPNLS
jgi:Na+-driven multidrug efflux pump